MIEILNDLKNRFNLYKETQEKRNSPEGRKARQVLYSDVLRHLPKPGTYEENKGLSCASAEDAYFRSALLGDIVASALSADGALRSADGVPAIKVTELGINAHYVDIVGDSRKFDAQDVARNLGVPGLWRSLYKGKYPFLLEPVGISFPKDTPVKLRWHDVPYPILEVTVEDISPACLENIKRWSGVDLVAIHRKVRAT